MIVAYLLSLVIIPAVWIGLTFLIWRFWRRARRNSGGEWDFDSIIFTVIAILWLITSFWLGGGTKYYYDAKVKRLCARDGGIKIYETVKLPPKKFDEYAEEFYWAIHDENGLGQDYQYKGRVIYLREGNPNVIKSHTQIFRKSDMKLLGESIAYDRGGGDYIFRVGGATGFRCPEVTKFDRHGLMGKIFIKEKEDGDDHD